MLVHNRIYRMDALEGLKELDDESVDLVITDPPYNIAAKNKTTIRHGKIMSTMEAFGAWDCMHPFDYDLMINQVISQCYRVLKPGGSMYLFTARENNGFFARQAVLRGFTYRTQLAMIKTTPLPSFSKSNWRSAFDLCLLISKGMPKTFNFLSQRDCVNIFSYPIRHKQTTHPTEKPLDFIKKLVLVSSNPGDLVVDPFMGSGTTAVACQQTGRHFLGFEREKEYVLMARHRLKGGGAQARKHATTKSGERD